MPGRAKEREGNLQKLAKHAVAIDRIAIQQHQARVIEGMRRSSSHESLASTRPEGMHRSSSHENLQPLSQSSTNKRPRGMRRSSSQDVKRKNQDSRHVSPPENETAQLGLVIEDPSKGVLDDKTLRKRASAGAGRGTAGAAAAGQGGVDGGGGGGGGGAADLGAVAMMQPHGGNSTVTTSNCSSILSPVELEIQRVDLRNVSGGYAWGGQEGEGERVSEGRSERGEKAVMAQMNPPPPPSELRTDALAHAGMKLPSYHHR